MNKNILGVIDATTYLDPLKDLTEHRILAALPFGGRYRLIDFVLSSMVNSGISSVAVFPKYHYRSLMDHLESGKNWDLNRKRDGLFFFPAPNLDIPFHHIGSFQCFSYHLDYFKRSTQEYAIVSNCYTVLNVDFCEILEKHIENGCDITEVVSEGRSLETYLLKRELLIDLIVERDITGYQCLYDLIEDPKHSYQVCTYEYEDYCVMVDSIETYYRTSLELLNPSKWQKLFKESQPIFTKVKDEPPTKYTKNSNVTNSMIANGCVIEGHVENSIISRSVKIGKGSVVKNCIIMQKSIIGENCVLDSVILDKDVRIEDGVHLTGGSDEPIVIKKGAVQGVLMS
ncbi:glucose-1-phosphate adenylyltransferase [Peribacillus deserti]|uniref:Glucose-1-phosphate adenylyltransferase n=1 Tax=Peribacillus deserti TaxID=673318 RepID=A0ABS2QIN3_9BACI|nr:sugar phosphate nucleotidyltransferase [Peribacillus deserti]MBM7692994.1 glucose-1-phosphate adenylyltransferase [Peribacillus deserti]